MSMKINDIAKEIDNFNDVCKITDLEHLFNVYQDSKGNYKYNLNSTLYINANDSDCSYFTVTHDCHWTLVSYIIYGTTRLAWLLMKLNKVKAADVFAQLKAGTTVKYLTKDIVQKIIETIN